MNTLRALFMASLCTLFIASVHLQAQDRSIDLNEINDYISLPSSNLTFSIGTGVHTTIEFWMSTREDNSSYQTLYSKEGEFGIYLFNNELIVNVANGNVDHYSGKTLNDGNWHHISLVLREGQSNGSELWINGVQEFAFTYTFNNMNGLADIGSRYSGAYWPYSGKVDEFRFWTYARFESQLSVATNPSSYTAADWGLGAYYPMNNASGSSVFDVTGNNVTATLYNNTNPRKNGFTIAPDYTSPEFVSAPSLAFNSTDSVVVSFEVNEQSDMFYVLMAAGASTPTKTEIFNGTGAGGASPLLAGTQSFSAGNLSETLSISGLAEETGYRLFSVLRDVPEQNEMETPQVTDFTTQSNDPGNAIQLSAANDYVEAYTDFPSVLDPSSGLTVETWVKFDEFPSNSEVHTLFDKTDGNTGFRLFLEDGTINGEVFNTSTSTGELTIENSLVPGVWFHLAMTYDGNDIRIFVDGELHGSQSFSGNIGQNSVPVKLGEDFNGELDGARVWNLARSESDINSTLLNPLNGYETGLVLNYTFNLSTLADFYNPVGIADYDGRATVVNIADPTSSWVTSEAYSITNLPNFLKTPIIRPAIGGAEVYVTLDTTATIYYIVTDTNPVSITAADIKNGTGNASGAIATGSVNIPVIEEEYFFNVSGLDKFSSYRIYFALETDDSPAILMTDVTEQVFTTTTDKPGNAINFSNGEYIKLNQSFPDSLDPENEFTFETWAKIDYSALGANSPRLISNSGYKSGYYMNTNSNHLSFNMYMVDGEDYRSYKVTAVPNPIYSKVWHHLAVSYDGSFLRLYIDGIIQDSTAASGQISRNTEALRLGLYMKGELDGTRVWNVARSQVEIQSNMESQISGSHSGLILNYNYDLSGATGFYNTAGIHGFDGRATVINSNDLVSLWGASQAYTITKIPDFVNNSPVITSTTDNVNIQVETDAPGIVYYALFRQEDVSVTSNDIKNGTGNATSAVHVGSSVISSATLKTEIEINGLSEGVPYYLQLVLENDDETAVLSDKITATSFYTLVEGDGTALNFDGEETRVTMTTSLGDFGDQLTIEAWIKASEWQENSNEGTIVERAINDNTGFKLTVGDHGKAEFFLSTLPDGGGVNRVAVTSASIMKLNTWNHLAGVYDGDSLHIYVNGVIEASKALTGVVYDGSRTFGIGHSNYWLRTSADTNRYFSGSIDELRVWEVAKSKSEIRSGIQTQLEGTENGLRANFTFNDYEGTKIRDNSTHSGYATAWNLDSNGPDAGGDWIYSEAFDVQLGGPVYNMSTPSVNETLGNSAQFYVDLSELSKLSFIAVTSGSLPPTHFQIDGGVNYPGGNVIYASQTDSILSGNIEVLNLTPHTDYDFYIYAQSFSNGYRQFEPTKVAFNSGNLKSAFIQHSPRLIESTQTSATVNFSVNTPSRVYYIVLPDGTTSPTKEEVLSLSSSSNSIMASGSFIVSNTRLTTDVEIQGLTPETDYDVYAVSEIYSADYTAEILNPVAFDIHTQAQEELALVLQTTASISIGDLGISLPQATIEFWVYSIYEEILDTNTGSNSDGLIFGIYETTKYVYSPEMDDPIILPNSSPSNSWHHVAISWDEINNEIIVHYDGVEELRAIVNIGSLTFDDLGLFTDEYYGGIIDEFRIWNEVRETSEIQKYMSQTLTGIEDNLILYYNFEAYEGQYLTDQTDSGYNGQLINSTIPENQIISDAFIDWFAPAFEVAPYITDIVSSRFTVNTQISEPGKIHVLVWDANAAVPTAEEIKTGVTNKHAVEVHSSYTIDSWDNASELIVEGLQPNQAYHAWFIAEDNNDTPNLQADPVKLEFTTSDNALPVISNLQIIGYDFAISEELKASFSFVDADGDSASEAKYKWFVSDDVVGTNSTVITGATSSTYSPSPADLGKFLSFEAIPYDGELYGDTVQSAFQGPVITKPTFDERAISLDGTDDFVSVSPEISLSNASFTISFWSNRATNATAGYVLSADTTLDNYQSMYIGFPGENNDFQFGFIGDELTATNLSATSDWVHWAVTFNHTTNARVIYQDGVEVASDNAGDAFQGAGNIEIGRFRDQYFEGYIDDITMWDHVRLEEQIRRDMFKRLKGTESGLVAYWPVNDGLNSSTVSDISLNNNTGTLMHDAAFSNARVRPQGTFLTGNAGWRFLTAPVDSLTYGQFLKDIWTQGYPGATTNSGASNVYWYDEATRSWNVPNDSSNIVGTGSADGSSLGKGILIYAYDTGGWPKKLETLGKYSATSFNLDLKQTDIENDTQEGWHVVGNPYPFSIKWTELVARAGLTDLSPVIFIYDPTSNSGSGGYRVNYGFDIPNLPGSVAHNGVIEPFQAFWIRTSGNDSTGTVSFNTNDMTEGEGSFYGKTNQQNSTSDMENYILVSAENEEYGKTSLIQFSGEQIYESEQPFKLSEEPIDFGILNEERKLLAYQQNGRNNDISERRLLRIASLNDEQVKFKISGFSSWSEVVKVRLTELETGKVFEFDSDQTIELKAELIKENPQKRISNRITVINGSKVTEQQEEPSYNYELQILTGSAVSTTIDLAVPDRFELSQNYPNPFNPSTTISFSLPEIANVELHVFDLQGRLVSTLVSDRLEAGYHSKTFNASNLASGIYFYRLKAGSFSTVKKLTLIK